MDAASNNLAAIVRDHDLWIESSPHSSAATNRLSKALLLRENMISNLNFRAKAFVSRMDNEIKCVSTIYKLYIRNSIDLLTNCIQASNFVAVGDSNISKGILKQTRNEGKVLSDTVSFLTLLFLPSTFISVSNRIQQALLNKTDLGILAGILRNEFLHSREQPDNAKVTVGDASEDLDFLRLLNSNYHIGLLPFHAKVRLPCFHRGHARIHS